MKSPSAGELSSALDAAARALAYAREGASMVSVLVDGPFFGGAWTDLADARARLDAAGLGTPLLAKEFVLDEVQIRAAHAAGADAILLIARIVAPEELARLASCARAVGLEALVEVMDERELESALAAGARVVGVNARDLDTLDMDAARTARVLAGIPAGTVAVHLSGLKSPRAVEEAAATRADAALIGEALMREADPAPLLREMLASARPRT
jgi:indole-3-glycerol phosphate synthase